jgi:hypothetical protein
MGTKKQAEKSKKLWIKVLAVIIGVVFVVLMVVSSMGSSWISSLATVKPGDVVVVDYTLKDPQGVPIMTSNAQLYTKLTSQGSGLIYSKPITITAGQNLTTSVFPIQFYSATDGWSSQNQFALFSTEYNTIGSALIGMNPNGQKTVSLVPVKPLTQYWTADQLAASNMSISSINVGQHIVLGVSSSATAYEDNSSASSYVRMGEISNKTADGLTIDFSYPSIDITVDSINAGSSS